MEFISEKLLKLILLSVMIAICSQSSFGDECYVVYYSHTNFSQVSGNGDANLDPGETWRVGVDIVNWCEACDPALVQAGISGNYITDLSGPLSYGMMSGGDHVTNYFDFLISSLAPCGTNLSFNVLIVCVCDGYCASQYGAFTAKVTDCPPSSWACGETIDDGIYWSAGSCILNWPYLSSATAYRLYRGTLADLPDLLNSNADFCQDYEGTALSIDLLPEDPSEEESRCYYYLATYMNGTAEGLFCNATPGIRIVNSEGNCP